MNKIGELLKTTREQAGVSLEEASADLKIKPLILENIEDGNIGCFKDIFALKEYIYNYSKYLGLNSDKIIDEFNEYLFEYTSKIPVNDIEKAIEEKQKDEPQEEKIISPYTVEPKNGKNKYIKIVIGVAIGLALIVAIWSIWQITINNTTTKMVSYTSSRR